MTDKIKPFSLDLKQQHAKSVRPSSEAQIIKCTKYMRTGWTAALKKS